MGNASIPFGVVTSTARKGRKWFDIATSGDCLEFAFTETGEVFGAAAVVKTELVTFADIIARATENHIAHAKDTANVKLRLQCDLQSAYGASKDTDEFSIVHFIRLNTDRTPRALAYEAIDSERDYQEHLRRAAHGTGGQHEVAAFLLFMDEYMTKAKTIAATDWSPQADARTMEIVRKVAALAVAAMEIHGVEPRKLPDTATIAARVAP
jgi:hypothetical protein